MPMKFIKKLRKYVKVNTPSFDTPDEAKIENFTFESDEAGECVLSFRLAKFMLTLIDDVDELSYYLDKEQDYNRLLKTENFDLKEEVQFLQDKLDEYYEDTSQDVLDLTNSKFIN